jgi:hypothetical protein
MQQPPLGFARVTTDDAQIISESISFEYIGHKSKTDPYKCLQTA